MDKANFLDLLQRFSMQPRELPSIVAASADPEQIFDAAKPFIQDALSHDQLAQAEQAMDFALAIAAHTANPDHRALADWCCAIFFENREIRQAFTYYQAAQRHYQQTQQTEKEGRVLIGCATQLNLLGRLDEAEQTIQRAAQYLTHYPDYRDWPLIYINLAYIQIQQGRYHDAILATQRAEESARYFSARSPEQQSRYQWMLAQAFINHGYAARVLGHWEEAGEQLHAALYIADALDFSELAGRANLNLARLATSIGDLFGALHYLHTARANFNAAQITIDQATVALEEAYLYQRLMMLRHARRAAEQAADAFKQAGIPAENVEANLLATQLSLALGESSKARTSLSAVQQQLDAAPPVLQALWRGYQAHPLLQNCSDEYFAALAQGEDAASALHQLGALEEALVVDLLVAQLAAKLPLPDRAKRFQQIAETAHQAGLNALEQQAWSQLAQFQPPAQAIQSLRRAADIIGELRTQMPAEELKANLITGHAPLYTHLIEAQLKRRQSIAAFSTLLEAKGGIWADLAAPVVAQTPNTALLSAKAELNFWRENLREASEPAYKTVCEAKIQEASALVTVAARQQARLRSPQPLPSLTKLQERLAPELTVLEYMVGTTHIWACLFTAQHPPQWVRVCKSAEMVQLQGRLTTLLKSVQACQTPTHRQQIAQAQQAWIQRLLQQLYQQLITPLTAYLPTSGSLVIVPDAYLFETPWTALYDGLDYLGERYPITLTPSSALLALQESVATPRLPTYPQTCYALGYAGHPPLAFVADELSAIQATMADALLVNPASSHHLRWDSAPDCLHIAAHAQANLTAPLLSALELADGSFLLADVFNLALHGTRLVTLSACDTGLMPEQGGVSLALAGAFLCAGARSVIASLWPVDDQATQILMSHFYAQWQSGDTVAAALQRAQAVVRQSGYSHPFYWAAFQPLVRA